MIMWSHVLELVTDLFAYTRVCMFKHSYQRNIAEHRPSMQKL